MFSMQPVWRLYKKKQLRLRESREPAAREAGTVCGTVAAGKKASREAEDTVSVW
jgi:hypothetical protein